MSTFRLPQVVVAWERGKRPKFYGPFSDGLTAADFATEHRDQTGITCEVRPLEEAPIYGDEGL